MQSDGSAASMKDSTPDVLHCGEPAIVRFPYEIKQIAQERSLDYPPREREYEYDSEGNPILPFEYQEHCSLGNALHLKGHDTHPFGQSAKFNALKLDNGLELTYGEINGLAGDFFGTDQPISDGGNVEEQKRRFYEAYKTLAEWKINDTKARELLDVLRTEAKAVDEAIRKGEDPSTAYAKLWPSITNVKFTLITALRSGPGYLKLASLNVDHFGLDARTAYNAGHLRALEEAARGEIDNLRRAYTMNAFADHFLQDSFASGHMRTPRRKLAGVWSFQAKAMHDEDNKNGLYVSSPPGANYTEWKAFGDTKLLDKVHEKGLQQCLLSLNESVDEIYQAWNNKTVIEPKDFKAWQHAPTLESAKSPKNFPPMYNSEGKARS